MVNGQPATVCEVWGGAENCVPVDEIDREGAFLNGRYRNTLVLGF